jgi:hypothetical protein
MDSRWLLASLAALALGPAKPEGVAVRWAEGTVHGFVELRTQAGELLARGDLLQAPRDSDIESRLVFHFTDGSVFRETVTFTQHGVFRMETYHLVQSGKDFPADLDATLSRNGDYVVRSTSHKDGKEDKYTGTLDLPADTYNGMVPVVGKNVDRKAGQSVHIVAFTPKPMVIPLDFAPAALDSGVIRFTLKPKLSLLLKIGAALKKQTPPDSHLWILTDDVPAFVRFEGPLYSGPVWRIDLATPRWSGDRPRTE